MDDLLILDYDLEKLKRYFKLIIEKINNEDLEVNKKSNIYKLSNGFTFLGYTFYRIKRYLKKLYKEDKDKYKRSVASYKGYFMISNYNRNK
ncbi:MAG: hypothetical protein PHX04_04250 [Bacilli bacterium]|nr:hypothetical protein [Bacilli bacterium]